MLQVNGEDQWAALTCTFGCFFSPSSSALHSVSPCIPLDRREVPSVIIDYEDDKENMPNESDYEDLPSMYKDEDDDVDDEDEDEDDDDSIFTSERLQLSARLHRYGNTNEAAQRRAVTFLRKYPPLFIFVLTRGHKQTCTVAGELSAPRGENLRR